MKKYKAVKAVLIASLGVILMGASVANAEDSASTPFITQPGPDASQCVLKTDLAADKIKKCTEAMAKNDGAVLKTEDCCQEKP